MENLEEQHPQSRSELVRGAHRVIRRLDGAESPLSGDLVSDGDRQRVLVDAEGVDATLWEFAAAEHVAGVRDVVRRADGHDVLLPWCLEPVDVLLARRSGADRPLRPGEIVTLVGSLVRGIAEVAGRPTMGRWWIEDGGRPLFVPGEGVACGLAASGLVERVRDECADRGLQRVLTRIGAGLTDHRVVQRSIDEWEAELAELAAPRALECGADVKEDVQLAPERVRSLAFHRAALADGPWPQEEPSRVGERVRRIAARARERVRELVANRSAGAHRADDDDARTTVPRRRILLVGVGAAALVLIGGLLWPGGDGDVAPPRAAAADAQRRSVPSPTPSAGPSGASTRTSSDAVPAEAAASDPAVPDDAARSGAEQDVEHAAGRLLKAIDRCRAEKDSDCGVAIVAGSAGPVLDRLGVDSAGRDAALVEDYGDIAVIRLGAAASPGEQMLVLVRQKDGWLVRDVYDVADQPSGGG